MNELKHQPLSDLATLTGTTVVYRERNGEPEYVVVCGECEEVKTIGLKDGMRAALQSFMRWHCESRHRESVVPSFDSFVCWSSEVKVAYPATDLAVTGDNTLWHDHSGNGGDIVCTGPFGLFVDDPQIKSLRNNANAQSGGSEK